MTDDFKLGVATPFLLVLWGVPIILLNSWVLTKLWMWFLVPCFGLQPLRMVFAYGIMLIVRFVMPHQSTSKETQWYVVFLMPIVNLLVPLGIGYIASLFV